jgi:hypothetical protein
VRASCEGCRLLYAHRLNRAIFARIIFLLVFLLSRSFAILQDVSHIATARVVSKLEYISATPTTILAPNRVCDSHFLGNQQLQRCRVLKCCRTPLEHTMAETSTLNQLPHRRPKCRNFDTVGKPYTCDPHLPPDNLCSDLPWSWFPWEYVALLASSA